MRVLAVGPQRLAPVRALTRLPLRVQTGADCWLAFLPETGDCPAGAAALHPDGALWIAVVPALRRRGVGRALHATAMAAAQAQGLARVVSWRGTDTPEAAAFCAAVGLQVVRTIETFETTLANTVRFFGRYRDRLLARGRLPAGILEQNDGEVPWGAYGAALIEAFGPPAAVRLDRILRSGLEPNEWAQALHLDGRPVAVTLGSRGSDWASTDLYLVQPAFRRGWAHIESKFRAARRLHRRHREIERHRFSTADEHGDTRRAYEVGIRRGFEAARIACEHYYACELEKPSCRAAC
ncbi:MAG TPA: hypothetical protein PKE44_13205 [Plasticicumulans sp.]|uniref:GNAT family N-acetyltransferase n=1 Tax=Plasticicumulans sp. TaxID=2307179 RepID=UPI002C9F6F8D|nr:GNAT family N-acetyltransferase [Plasticicumulans sp.]HMW30514.1 hypothetical protein [Plasticicumulans sp.]HNM44653.1 hypothetical protein [Plasticicumulans sp.]